MNNCAWLVANIASIFLTTSLATLVLAEIIKCIVRARKKSVLLKLGNARSICGMSLVVGCKDVPKKAAEHEKKALAIEEAPI
jgi:uncharacterized membrane protein YadS